MSPRKPPHITLAGSRPRGEMFVPPKQQGRTSRPEGLPDTDVISQVSMAFQQFFGALESVRRTRVGIALEADPLGIATGAYAERAVAGPGGPTFERLGRAAEIGEQFKRFPVLDGRGAETGQEVLRITPVIQDLRRRGTISGEEFAAATQFCKHWQFSEFPGPAAVNYGERTDKSYRETSPTERMIHHRDRVYKSFQAVNVVMHPAMAWLIAAMGDPMPLWKLGAYYSPGMSQPVQSAKGGTVLQLCLAVLCQYYGIDHRLTQTKISAIVKELVDSRLSVC